MSIDVLSHSRFRPHQPLSTPEAEKPDLADGVGSEFGLRARLPHKYVGIHSWLYVIACCLSALRIDRVFDAIPRHLYSAQACLSLIYFWLSRLQDSPSRCAAYKPPNRSQAAQLSNKAAGSVFNSKALRSFG